MAPDAIARVAVVLDRPKDVVNVAGVVRVMLNFGLRDLRLVRPDDFDPYRIEGIAHRSGHVVESTRIYDSLADALADRTWVVGATARARTAGRRYARAREAAAGLARRASGGAAALVFGREDRGLRNEDLDLCHEVAIVPTAPEHPSLNLAQAALVMAYETFLAAEGDPEDLPRGRRATRPPTRAELEETYAALEAGLGRIDFFKARKPAAVLRTLRTLLARAEPDLREARLLAAVGYEIGHYIDRMGREGPEREGG